VDRAKVGKKSHTEDRHTARRTSDDEKLKQRESRVRFSDEGPTTSGNTQGDDFFTLGSNELLEPWRHTSRTLSWQSAKMRHVFSGF
jgi:hypothetical protein